jgi:hypothetical protein
MTHGLTPDRPSAPRWTRRQLFRHAAVGLGAATLATSGLSGIASAATRTLTSSSDGETLRLARVLVRSVEDAARLAGFDDTHAVFADGSVEVLLWPGDLARLEATGLPFEITVDDVIARDQLAARSAGAGVTGQPGQREDYRRLADYEHDLTTLAAAHPDRARLVKLPLETLEGRSVYGIEIADDVHAVDQRPTFYMDGLHHAREWPSGELTMMFAFDLLESSGDDRVAATLRDVRTLLVPVVNPDGFSWSRDAVVQTQNAVGSLALIVTGLEAYWRKNRRSFTGVTAPVLQRNPDAHGVDPNRNYGFLWGGPGTTPTPVTQDHCGAAPFSEPEAENIRRLVLSRHITTLLTHHTYGDMVLRAWGHTRDEPAEEAVLKELADAFAASNGYDSMKGIDLYATTGVTDDWAYAATSGIGFCFEHGPSFHPPYVDSVPAMYAKNRDAFLQAAEAAADRSLHGVVRARAVDGAGNPVPATLTLEKSFVTPVSRGDDLPEEQATTAEAADGVFDYDVNPSTRPMVALDGGSESYLATIAVDGHDPVIREVTIARGQTVDLGTLTFGEAPAGGGSARGRPTDVPRGPRR